MEKVLVIEDADSLRDVLSTYLDTMGYEVTACASAEEGLERILSDTYNCILADFKLPGQNGIDLLREARKINNTVPYIIMTAYGTIDLAVEAMKEGANDFIRKPFEPDMLTAVLAQVMKNRRVIDQKNNRSARRQRHFLTEDPACQHLLTQVRKVAQVDSPVLVLGESGTGKEIVARQIHEQSLRKDEMFLPVNCAALPETLLESEFFGHEEGSFTGATRERAGVFEYASAGTVFLDEIGDISTSMQVKLLRALQEGEIRRIGANRTRKAAPRIVSATNVDVLKAIEAGGMREDFYYRLAVVTLKIPPLRERVEDIRLLSKYFVDYFCREMGRSRTRISQKSMSILLRYSWPGNVRELENVLERAVVLAGRNIEPEHLGINPGVDFSLIEEAKATLQQISGEAARKAEMEIIAKTLKRTRGNKSEAARLLGVSYKTMLNKLKSYQIS